MKPLISVLYRTCAWWELFLKNKRAWIPYFMTLPEGNLPACWNWEFLELQYKYGQDTWIPNIKKYAISKKFLWDLDRILHPEHSEGWKSSILMYFYFIYITLYWQRNKVIFNVIYCIETVQLNTIQITLLRGYNQKTETLKCNKHSQTWIK